MNHGDPGHRCRCSHGPRCAGAPPQEGLAAAALDTRVRPLPMGAEAESMLRQIGAYTPNLDGHTVTLLSCVHSVLPPPPLVSNHAALSALLPPRQDGGDDRISDLPDKLLRDIVSRLPVKDGARTAALSCRWRGVWRSVPLVLVDSDLLPVRTGSGLQVAHADAQRVASAVTRILEAHPGPFRCVHLICSFLDKCPDLLARWLQLLAVKGVQELVLVNRPWPLNMPIPPTFFAMATLTRLYLGVFEFPDTRILPRAASFPHLRELGLCCVQILRREDMDFILARSPVLEILCIQVNMLMKHLILVSRSLRCVQIIESIDLSIALKDAPNLERLIIWAATVRDGVPRSVKIDHAPALSLLGYLDPERHSLEIGNTVIKAGTTASPSTMVPSVKILGIRVCFGVRNIAKMLPCFLRCFPNVERLHLESNETDEPTGKLNNKFWQEVGPIECVQSHMKLMVFYGFRGERGELSFLKFVLESALVLAKLVIVFTKGSFTSMAEASSKVKPLFAAKWANKDCSLVLLESVFQAGEDKWLLNFKAGSDFSTGDPFTRTAALRGCNF
ncbi:unnamed protein product [Triticum turgidum subsp. durum]|uniref:F-box domain-containing protein n=1 Tax=Triticum turgidum subsp. durum TaxID=4567 RepID=A0A9R0W9J2_TRITD|nr:unnamed protein product [Triticum turgidum subsp. durum]